MQTVLNFPPNLTKDSKAFSKKCHFYIWIYFKIYLSNHDPWDPWIRQFVHPYIVRSKPLRAYLFLFFYGVCVSDIQYIVNVFFYFTANKPIKWRRSLHKPHINSTYTKLEGINRRYFMKLIYLFTSFASRNYDSFCFFANFPINALKSNHESRNNILIFGRVLWNPCVLKTTWPILSVLLHFRIQVRQIMTNLAKRQKRS